MKKSSILFIIIVFTLSWIPAGLFHLLQLDYQSVQGVILGSLTMVFPLISVIIVQHINKEPILRNSGISWKLNRWWIVAILLPVIINLLALIVSIMLPTMSFTTENEIMNEALKNMSESIPGINAYSLLAITLVSSISTGLTINAVFAFGEEIAWRGWLLKQFEGTHFLKTSLIIGIIWGLWHAPLILLGHNYPEHPIAGVFMMILICILLTPIFQYIRIKSGSVITVAIMHGTFNAGSGITMFYTSGFNDLLGGSAGLAGCIVLLIVNSVIYAIDKWKTKEHIMTSQISC